MVRTPCFDNNGRKKGAWSPEEDNKLRAYIQRYGHWNWRELPKFAGLSRCGKSCRLRWMNYLRPNVKRGNYTKEEEDIIIKLHEALGNKWSAIAAKLPGRTDNEIKNHWHTHLKKRSKQNKSAKIKNQSTGTDSDRSESKADHRERSTEMLKCEANQEVESDDQPCPILESSALFPEPSSSEISSLSSDYAMLSGGVNRALEDSLSSLDSFAEPIENFWTQPFLADTYCDDENKFSSNFVEGGFVSPFDSYYDDDSMDFLSQVLQELPKS
ncbi:hypothetical protein CsSME_00019533 [Camellia sinensis var. sinensis]